jgi:hypothetical protein
MSQQQEKGFGRRAAARTGAGGDPMLPLFKQIGGIAIGVVIALAIGATFVTVMKQAGRLLDQKFVENATSGAPDEAIKRLKHVDAGLEKIHQSCLERARTASLNTAQSRATDGYMELFAGENELARGAAYVECLAQEQPSRFCQTAHKAHLGEAVRQYFKLLRQMREAWAIALGGPGGIDGRALSERAARRARHAECRAEPFDAGRASQPGRRRLCRSR